MANHKSAIKRTRANEAKRQRNRYQAKTVRTMIKNVKENEAKGSEKDLPKLMSSIDKLAKKNVFHKNKASNLKSKLMKRANKAKTAPAVAPKAKAASKKAAK
jgi:small subunit ribosomal protein S20